MVGYFGRGETAHSGHAHAVGRRPRDARRRDRLAVARARRPVAPAHARCPAPSPSCRVDARDRRCDHTPLAPLVPQAERKQHRRRQRGRGQDRGGRGDVRGARRERATAGRWRWWRWRRDVRHGLRNEPLARLGVVQQPCWDGELGGPRRESIWAGERARVRARRADPHDGRGRRISERRRVRVGGRERERLAAAVGLQGPDPLRPHLALQAAGHENVDLRRARHRQQADAAAIGASRPSRRVPRRVRCGGVVIALAPRRARSTARAARCKLRAAPLGCS
mmetsp:Transcript_1418/g.4662  ORF Transcript_1418/g.4662 Transcript_1418/m.4662 type:complete len:280 (+) Transcript_1418:760-1599(+)